MKHENTLIIYYIKRYICRILYDLDIRSKENGFSISQLMF